MRPWQSLTVGFGLLLATACGGGGADSPPSVTAPPSALPFDLRLQEVFGTAAGLSGLMDLQAPPGDARLFIAERPGRIRIVQNGALLPTPFLDISSRVLVQQESGFLSFTFHPQFANGQPFVFVHFVENVPNTTGGDIVVERYQVSSSDPNLLDVSSVQPVIRISHRDFTNHYGGRVAFGPDGKFYLSAGDGGGANNQLGNAQNAAALLGKILRLDVDTLPYTIPTDNPVFPGAARNENWAIGLRNPFRYAFDVPTGQLYIADVGQSAREEIDVVPAGAAGLNYGWSIMEGSLCVAIGGDCTTPGLTAPVYDYDHGQGCAIIGGYVYRGAAIPELRGQYVFSDFCSGFVRALSLVNGVVTVGQATANAGSNVVQSFGQDAAGELYILTGDGRVLQIVGQ
ncbi:MAG TPA: PQQ-dependent sugar dehydrogenase [Burkholderiales bacterium]